LSEEEDLAKQHTLTLPTEEIQSIALQKRGLLVWGDPCTCWKNSPDAPELIINVKGRPLTWNHGPYPSPRQKNTNKEILAEIYGSRCYNCRKPLKVGDPDCTIEHTDKESRDHNCLHCSLLYCFKHNSGGRRNPRRVRVSASTSQGQRKKIQSIVASEDSAARLLKWSSKEGAKHDDMFPAYRRTLFDLLHNKIETYAVVPETPGKIPAQKITKIIAANTGIGVHTSYSKYVDTDELTILTLAEEWLYVDRIISGAKKRVPRRVEYYYCRQCFVAWEKRKKSDLLADFEILDHPAFPSEEKAS
jgi:hypothetical protein